MVSGHRSDKPVFLYNRAGSDNMDKVRGTSDSLMKPELWVFRACGPLLSPIFFPFRRAERGDRRYFPSKKKVKFRASITKRCQSLCREELIGKQGFLDVLRVSKGKAVDRGFRE